MVSSPESRGDNERAWASFSVGRSSGVIRFVVVPGLSGLIKEILLNKFLRGNPEISRQHGYDIHMNLQSR